jgi:hypothetical protein
VSGTSRGRLVHCTYNWSAIGTRFAPLWPSTTAEPGE